MRPHSDRRRSCRQKSARLPRSRCRGRSLHARDVTRWLDPTVKDADKVAHLLAPYPPDEMEWRLVSKRVSNPDNEGPELIELDNSVPELWT